jgi:hypothetical protein
MTMAKRRRWRRKPCVIASGGFANNKEWIKKSTGYDLGVNLLAVGNSGKMGDASEWLGSRCGRGRYFDHRDVPAGPLLSGIRDDVPY